MVLPDEILHSILRHAHPRESVALERTARRFRDVANEPLLWRFYCLTFFDFWDKRHEIQQKLSRPTSSIDWKRLYAVRSNIDAATTKALDSILSSQRGRVEKIQEIINFGYDVKDTLMRHSHAGLDLDDHLARRYVSCFSLPYSLQQISA
jgi:F-box protein 21